MKINNTTINNSNNSNTRKDKHFKLYDYNVYDSIPLYEKKTDYNKYKDNKKFIIQIFGINENGNTASIYVDSFYPFFYIKVGDDWNEQRKTQFIYHLKKKMGNYYEDSIIDSKLLKKHKLYLFDNKKLHNFIKINFTNNAAYNRCKKIFYKDISIGSYFERKLLEEGYIYNDDSGSTHCYLYEGDIPPLLKLFHLKEISPSGWISLPSGKTRIVNQKTTNCAYEYIIKYNDIVPLKSKEAIVNYKICSFDIEASSSHGDFPVAIKDYKKLATNILENYNNKTKETQEIYNIDDLKNEIFTAFGLNNEDENLYNHIKVVYPKIKSYSLLQINNIFDNFIKYIPADNKCKKSNELYEESDSEEEDNIDELNINNSNETINYSKYKKLKKVKFYNKKDANILDLIKDDNCEYATKLNELNIALSKFFPELEGDIITFIGLSFINYGENNPYKRIIIVKGGCQVPEKYIQYVLNNNITIIEKETEKEVLLTYTKIMNKENPHIVTGYNITGFDFQFMYERSLELNCANEFLKLSKNKDEICINKDWKTGKEDIENSKVVLASGEYNLKFPKMPGIIIMDMCVILRKEFQLSSHKLDYVSSYFISDSIKNIELNKNENTTKIYSKNLMGINIGTFIKFEELGFSNNPYKENKKFEILDINKKDGWFIINSYEELDLSKSKYNWGLAKDDVSPQEIFDLANGTDYDRWTVGKYCLGDCDNVLWLLLKIDVITDKVEMSNLCDVPLSFLMLRGQGIKLQSYVSKKCGEKNTLMPTIQKNNTSEGYEGAHVFNPKTGLYLEDPVACVDYSSLYPSSIISENLSPDSKVWTKEYDLNDNLINECGEKDENNNYIYDNLYDKGYTYVDIKFDTFKYIRPTEKAAAKKTVVGYKICRFAQFPHSKAIMPSILEELLGARKSTRKLIPLQTDEFMKNILDKRQLSIKVTANSLYGQLGASTSAFYEPDVASGTTAIGRKLLFYARSIIEECYNNLEITLSDKRKVITNAECVYGDTDSVFFKFNFKDAITGEKITNKEALIYTIELAKQAGELASKFLKKPHDLEYEKTFWPFVLLSKKRYVGMLYEDDPEKAKMKFMGIVLKRRDNAPIVKDIYGGVVQILMKEKSLTKSIVFVNDYIETLIDGKIDMEKLLITKSLRGYYKNPQQIAHKVLAERIGLRDSGNKPGTGDRVNYAYIKNENKKALQGEKIETPGFIKENDLQLDYSHYISNQIMKPLLQLFALELENIKEFKQKRGITLQSWYSEINKLKEKWPDVEKFNKKLEELRHKEIKSLIFDKYLKELK